MSFHNFSIEAPPTPAKAPEPGPSGSDPKPAPASGPTSVPSTSPGTPAAPSAPAPDADDADLDFGFDDTGTDDDSSGAQVSDDDAEPIQPIGPPPNATPAEVAQWRATHGVPAKPEAYRPPEIEGGWDTQALSPVLGVAHKHNVAQAAVAEALEAYAVAAQQKLAAREADRQRQDKERMAAVRSKLTPGERGAIDAAASAMSPDLRRALKGARTAEGEPLLANIEFVSLIAGLNKRGSGSTTSVARAQDAAAREAEIRQVMRTDYKSYIRQGLDKELAVILNRKGAA